MKRTLHNLRLCLLAFFAMSLFACASTEKLLDEGNYERLISVTQKRLAGKKINKAKYVIALEEGFNKLQSQDLARIDYLKQNANAVSWERVYEMALNIKRRQILLEPFLPLVADNGYKATFNFIKTEGMAFDAKTKASEFLYNRALDQIVLAREGDRQSARNAYANLLRINRYFSDYESKDALIVEARDLGTTRVWLEMENQSRVHLPHGFEEELLSLNFEKLDRQWTEFYVEPYEIEEMDYKANMNITGIFVSPETFHESTIVKRKKVQDGFMIKTDESGNAQTDSLGNKVKVVKYINVQAKIVRTEQRKAATVKGRMELIDLRKQAIVESRPIVVENVFNHVASTFYGDQRALDRSPGHYVNQPMPFPTDLDMIFKSAEDLKPIFIREIKACRLI